MPSATLGGYEPLLFDTLPAFDEAQANLTRFEPELGRLGGVVSRHGGDERPGLALLHRHFDMDSGEVLVETVDPSRRVAVGSPRRRADAGDVRPHLFRATRYEGGYRWSPLEFVDVPGGPEATDAYEWLREQGALLDELARTADAAGALGVFGVSLSHGREDIPCSTGEVLVEETDEIRRILTIRSRATDELSGTTTPTSWGVHNGAVQLRCTCQRDQSGSHQHFETN